MDSTARGSAARARPACPAPRGAARPPGRRGKWRRTGSRTAPAGREAQTGLNSIYSEFVGVEMCTNARAVTTVSIKSLINNKLKFCY